jgi:hypothetical protein
MDKLTIHNNFEAFKNDFKKDTGLDVTKETMSTYVQYYNARCNDRSVQILTWLTDHLMLQFKILPNDIRLQIADMIRTHETIKELLKK